MIKQNRDGNFFVTCTECGTAHESDTAVTFKDFLEEIKELGWTTHRVAGTWENYCPECSM